ncbi:MAG: alpha/beta fold hydrolase [Halobacterium sp.]
MRPPTRRDALRLAAAGFVALAGCSSDGGGTETTQTSATTEQTTTATTTTTERTTQTTTSPDAQRETALRITRLLGDGDFEAVHGLLAERVREQSSPDGLRSAWEQTTAEFGPFTGTSGVERTTANGNDVLVVRATFEAGVLSVVVTFDDADEIIGLRFVSPQSAYSPPAYADQSAFSETDLSLSSPACELGATLTTPADGADAGVVLVHGSGPNDRDGTLGPNKPLKDIAWGLASEGVAVLRYDKRTYACDAATDELGFGPLVVDDALTALSRLRSETDVSETAVVGHSLGGYAAPRIADRDGDASAFMLAANSRPLYAIVPGQIRYLANLDGSVGEAEREQIEAAEATADRLANGNYEDGGFAWGASFWRDVADYDPVSVAAELDAPAYALQGGRDYQVSPTEDFPAWQEVLPNDRARLYDDLNHLFIAGEGQPNPSEYFQPGNVAEAVVTDLAEWLTA